MPAGSSHDVFVGCSSKGIPLFRVQLRRSSGQYQVRGLVRNTSGSNQATAWYTIADASHVIEIAWQAATTPGGTDGSLGLWLDGTPTQTVGGVANGAYRLAEVRLGPSSGVGDGTPGTEYYDAFASTRTTYIGP